MIDLKWDRELALEQAGEDEELLAELLDLLRESAGGDLEKIKSAHDKGNVELMGEAAHSIKGAAASLGIEVLREAAYGIEKAGRDGDLDTASSYLPSLESIIAELATLK